MSERRRLFALKEKTPILCPRLYASSLTVQNDKHLETKVSQSDGLQPAQLHIQAHFL